MTARNGRAPRAATKAVAQRIRAARGVLFDLDGTLALGDRHSEGYNPLPGALELIGALQRAQRPFVIFTNGTHHTPAHYVEMLAHAGFSVPVEAMLTPSVVAADFFARKGHRRVLVLGGIGVAQPLIDAGIEIVRPGGDETEIDAIYVGWHPTFGLADIDAACRAAWAGAPLYTASNAMFFATRSGKALGVSAVICASIKSVTGQRVNVVGKPSRVALSTAARRLGVAAAQMVVIGDDPILETAMARAGGACAVGVTTGLATAETYAALPRERRADLVVTGVADLLAYFA